MRILMLAQFYAPIVGGEERHVQDLSIELVRRGHEVAVVSFWHPGLPEFELDEGVRVYRIRSTTQRLAWLYSEAERHHAPPLPDPEALWALRGILVQERPDIVHAHNWLLFSYLPLTLWHDTPLVLSLHDYSLRCAKKRMVFDESLCTGPALRKCLGCAANHYGPVKGRMVVGAHWLMQRATRAAVDMFLPVSQATADGSGLAGSGLPYRVIPNFVPDQIEIHEEKVAAYTAGLPADGYLLFVGDLAGAKGVNVLLQAYAGLKDAPPLVLIGRRRTNTPMTLPPKVMLMERWPHPAVLAAWRRCSIALVPSVWSEPFGIVAIEAMAAGRPVIASRIGGLADIVVPGQTGLLVPPGDVTALRQAIRSLLGDPVRREQMGLAAQQRVSMFHAGVVVPRIECIYEEVILSVMQKKGIQVGKGSYRVRKS